MQATAAAVREWDRMTSPNQWVSQMVGVAVLTAFLIHVPSALSQEKNAPKKTAAVPGDHPCDGNVWCGLFLATATKSEGPAHAMADRLAKAFPDAAGFQLVGEHSESIFKEYECWIVPSRELFLKIDSLGLEAGKTKDSIHVHFQLWQKDHVLLKSDAILRRSPVFICGPEWGDRGQLIMVLKLACEGEEGAKKAAEKAKP